MAGIVPLKITKVTRGQKKNESYRAKNYLTELVLDEIVDIKGYGLDQHERVLGVVSFKGKNINLEMIRAGVAKVYKGCHPVGLNLEPYRRAEEEARKAKRGMWALKN